MKKILLLIIPFLFIFSSCELEEETECLANNLDILSLENTYDCINTKNNMEIDLVDQYMIIRSQNQFDALVTGDCQPQINFTAYDLIIGKRMLQNGNNSIAYEYSFDCNLDELLLIVIFNQNETTATPNLTYHALIPKLDTDQMTEVRIVLD